MALQIAILFDLEGRAAAERYFEEVVYAPAGQQANWERNGGDRKTLDRWRNYGRRGWSQLGEWPWAASPQGDGQLLGPKGDHRWWRHPVYAEALKRWALDAS